MTAIIPGPFSLFGETADPVPAPSLVGAHAWARLLRLLGQPMRFGIVKALLHKGPLSFSELKRHVDITDGNLSIHARKLEAARLVASSKGFRRSFPRTEYRLTPFGRATIEHFLEMSAK